MGFGVWGLGLGFGAWDFLEIDGDEGARVGVARASSVLLLAGFRVRVCCSGVWVLRSGLSVGGGLGFGPRE